MYQNTKEGFKRVVTLYKTTVNLPHDDPKTVLSMLKNDLSEYINNFEGQDTEHLEKVKHIVILSQDLDTFDQELDQLITNLYSYAKDLDTE